MDEPATRPSAVLTRRPKSVFVDIDAKAGEQTDYKDGERKGNDTGNYTFRVRCGKIGNFVKTRQNWSVDLSNGVAPFGGDGVCGIAGGRSCGSRCGRIRLGIRGASLLVLDSNDRHFELLSRRGDCCRGLHFMGGAMRTVPDS
jgi:hypothetical protein